MITKDNYIGVASTMDLSSLNDVQKENHDFAVKYMHLYGKNEDITDVIDIAIDTINKVEEAEKSKKIEENKKAQQSVKKANDQRVTNEDLKGIVSVLMPKHQQRIIIGNPELKSVIKSLQQDLEKIPDYAAFAREDDKNYDLAKSKGIDYRNLQTVYAHYFHGGSDWFVLAKDIKQGVLTAYCIINQDAQMSEEGDVSIDDLTSGNRVELDFYWEPKSLAEALYKKYPDEFPEPENKNTQSKAIDDKKNDDETFEFLFHPANKNGKKLISMLKSKSATIKNVKDQSINYLNLKYKNTNFGILDNGGEFKLDSDDVRTFDVLYFSENSGVIKSVEAIGKEVIEALNEFIAEKKASKAPKTSKNIVTKQKPKADPFKKGDKVKIIGLKNVIPDNYLKLTENPFDGKYGVVDHYQNDDVRVNVLTERFGLCTEGFLEANVVKVTAAEYKKGIAKVKPKKQPVSKVQKPTTTEVEVVPIEVTYIRSFLKLDKTTVTYADIRKRVSKMQKDILLKKIRKTSAFAPAIDKIQEMYNSLLKTMNKGANSAVIDITPATIELLTKGLNITQSVEIKIIKRFLNLYAVKANKTEMVEKAKKLIVDIDFLLQKNIVTDKSSHYAEIVKIKKDLKSFIDTQKMDVSTYVLDGLNKIMNTNYSVSAPGQKKKSLNGMGNVKDVQQMEYLEETNAEKAFDDLKTYVDMVIDGVQPALIISGPAGIGKTYVVKERLIAKKVPFEYIKGRATAAALFVSLYENNGKTIVFDDCDSIIKSGNEDAINILKAVLDSYDTREVSWLTMKKPILDAQGEEIPKTFVFTGQVIFLTNIPLKDMKEALLSRSFKVELNLSIEDIIQKMKKTLPKLNTTAPMYLREKALQTILDLYNTGADIELNMRTLQQAIRIMQTVSDSTVATRMIAQQCATVK